jgi:hypothetical protein
LGRSWFEASLGKYPKKKAGCSGCTCHPSSSGKHKIGGFQPTPSLSKKKEPISRKTRENMAGEVAQAVEHFPIKCGALSSNSSTTTTTKTNKQKKTAQCMTGFELSRYQKEGHISFSLEVSPFFFIFIHSITYKHVMKPNFCQAVLRARNIRMEWFFPP